MRSRVSLIAQRAARSTINHPSIGLLAPPLTTTIRHISSTAPHHATALPITASGPPPSAPLPSAHHYGERIDKRRRQAEMLRRGKELRAAAASPSNSSSATKTHPLKKRFWSEVHVKTIPADQPGAGGLQIHLDARPVRTPSKQILTVPPSKPHLAYAIAIEWDLLESAQQALKNHNIPMTSLASRAHDIAEADRTGQKKIRDDLITMLIRYLDTDTLLCWAPERSIHEGAKQFEMAMGGDEEVSASRPSLRQTQINTAMPIIAFLTTTVWPGVELKPVLPDEGSIMPVRQDPVTKSVISGWIAGLPAYELAALERAVLASKSLLVGARLVLEWSEEFRDLQRTRMEQEEEQQQQQEGAVAAEENSSRPERFGIEEAAKASTLEVSHQMKQWGLVEDTHDVEIEDIRRQLGSVILLVSGHR